MNLFAHIHDGLDLTIYKYLLAFDNNFLDSFIQSFFEIFVLFHFSFIFIDVIQ